MKTSFSKFPRPLTSYQRSRSKRVQSLINLTSRQSQVNDRNYIVTRFIAIFSCVGFLHRNDTLPSASNCSQRIRLTPSGPSKVGVVWYREPRPIANGFDTYFTFQITDHSKHCTSVKDQYFSKRHHVTCSIRGADGFAFILQNSKNGLTAIGEDGGEM